ncbi:MAG TPA: Uma2 family endonuclease [Gemmatimonadaceae bacterium]|nr:Uma2 family endonuclease [Gemmatimonadaceae bacterium]
MAMPAAQSRHWTVREVRQLIADAPLATPRYELVAGELLVTPSPNALHQRAVGLLLTLLETYARTNRIGVAYPSPFDIELEAESLVQPDVFVTSLQEARRLLTEMPARDVLVAVEVISPSSARYDRVTKRALYQRHVSEYWVVDLHARLIERWTPNDERPEMLVDTLVWRAEGAAEPFTLELSAYFAEVYLER